MAQSLLVYISIPSVTDQAREDIPKQTGCQTVARALLHLAWKVLQRGAETEKKTRPHSASHGGPSLIPFTWRLTALSGIGLKSHSLMCFLIRNMLKPQLQKTSY